MKIRAMWFTAVSLVGIVGVGATASAAECDAALTHSLQIANERIARVQVSKPGQARAFAADGTEFTAGAVRRMRALLGLAELACGRGDARGAAEYLDGINGTFHQPAP